MAGKLDAKVDLDGIDLLRKHCAQRFNEDNYQPTLEEKKFYQDCTGLSGRVQSAIGLTGIMAVFMGSKGQGLRTQKDFFRRTLPIVLVSSTGMFMAGKFVEARCRLAYFMQPDFPLAKECRAVLYRFMIIRVCNMPVHTSANEKFMLRALFVVFLFARPPCCVLDAITRFPVPTFIPSS